jgi:hypothetical protein
MRKKWPKEVPVLVAGDICKGRLMDKEKYCLMGWAYNSFGRRTPSGWFRNSPESRKVLAMLRDACRKELGYSPQGDPIPVYNDSFRRSKAAIAKVWNQVMAKLGYVVGNPEK